MPRPTLPNEFKNMRTFEVILTQHTLEDIKQKMDDNIHLSKFTINDILAKKEAFLTNFIDNNPYAGHSWRTSGPERITTTSWLGTDETIMAKCIFLRELYSDLKLVAKVLNTNEYSDDIFSLTRFFTLSRDKDEELVMWEAIQYGKAKTEWEKKDAEWITERKLASEHTSHHTRKYWEELFSKDPDAKKWYKGIIPDTETTCKLCIKDAEFKRKQDEFEKQYEEKIARNIVEITVEQVIPRETKTYECEECNFKCTNQYSYNDHVQSMEHKTRMRFCKACDMQCRNDAEYASHLTSRKHKLATGEIDDGPKEYHCGPCQYTTTIKGNYTTHCKTKGHIEKTKE